MPSTFISDSDKKKPTSLINKVFVASLCLFVQNNMLNTRIQIKDAADIKKVFFKNIYQKYNFNSIEPNHEAAKPRVVLTFLTFALTAFVT